MEHWKGADPTPNQVEILFFALESFSHAPRKSVVEVVEAAGPSASVDSVFDVLLRRFPGPSDEGKGERPNGTTATTTTAVPPPTASTTGIARSRLPSTEDMRAKKSRKTDEMEVEDPPFEMLTLHPPSFDGTRVIDLASSDDEVDGDDTGKEDVLSARDQLALVRQSREEQWGGTPADKARALAASRASAQKYTAKSRLHRQLHDVRQQARGKWLHSGGGKKRMWTIGDLERKAQEEEEAVAEGFGAAPPSDARQGVHTFETAFEDPLKIGRRALELTNAFRAQQKKPPLMWHQSLCTIGQGHSKDMGDGKVAFGHDGFNQRMARYPFPARSAAENVAMSQGVADAAKVAVDGWIESPGHRKNLLGKHKYCGIGFYKNAQGAWYSTQLFGTP